jgi:hypothetical protein
LDTQTCDSLNNRSGQVQTMQQINKNLCRGGNLRSINTTVL